MAKEELEIIDNKADAALELWVENKRSFIAYELEGDIIYLLHTEVPMEQNGRGIAAQLVQKAFLYIEAKNLKVVPACSYVRAFLKRHPDWARIVAKENN